MELQAKNWEIRCIFPVSRFSIDSIHRHTSSHDLPKHPITAKKPIIFGFSSSCVQCRAVEVILLSHFWGYPVPRDGGAFTGGFPRVALTDTEKFSKRRGQLLLT